jgi:hypothetical protein
LPALIPEYPNMKTPKKEPDLSDEVLADLRAKFEEQNREFFELLNKEEPLLPELKKFWLHKGTPAEGIHHRLIQCSTLRDGYCAIPNKMYRDALARLEKFRNENDHFHATFCYTRPYYLDGFLEEVVKRKADDATYWKTLGELWIDCEGPGIAKEM